MIAAAGDEVQIVSAMPAFQTRRHTSSGEVVVARRSDHRHASAVTDLAFPGLEPRRGPGTRLGRSDPAPGIPQFHYLQITAEFCTHYAQEAGHFPPLCTGNWATFVFYLLPLSLLFSHSALERSVSRRFWPEKWKVELSDAKDLTSIESISMMYLLKRFYAIERDS